MLGSKFSRVSPKVKPQDPAISGKWKDELLLSPSSTLLHSDDARFPQDLSWLGVMRSVEHGSTGNTFEIPESNQPSLLA